MVRACPADGLGALALIWYTALPQISLQTWSTTLDVNRILAELKAERDRIDQAITSIENIGAPRARRGRPPGVPSRRRRKHRLTPEGRRRLSEMMKKRWAERRKKA
jgi:hypothetical protein